VTTAPVTYTIRVQGHLDDHWSTLLGGADVRRLDDGTTSLTIDGADQAQLHGVLAGLRDIGAVLVELHTSSRPNADRHSSALGTGDAI
jgi:hypothetical protein